MSVIGTVAMATPQVKHLCVTFKGKVYALDDLKMGVCVTRVSGTYSVGETTVRGRRFQCSGSLQGVGGYMQELYP